MIYVAPGHDDGETIAVCHASVSKRKLSLAIKRVKPEKVVPGTPRRLREVVTEFLQKDHLLWR